MTGGVHRVAQGELTAEEIIDRLHDGQRVVIEYEVVGTAQTVTLRFDGETYYCDTPTTLHRHETVEAMRTCLDEQRYARE